MHTDTGSLILAAEQFDPEEFTRAHQFSKNDERVIAKLMVHGPLLLQGGRGCGKSALMLAAVHRLAGPQSSALGVYINLKKMAFLRAEGAEYERILCDFIISEVQEHLSKIGGPPFAPTPDVASLQRGIAELSVALGRRVVLFFDDAAHIGREASLAPFFDTFRTLSSSTVSCKATIYPGVTQFGSRFDVFNDATVIDVIRNEEQADFVSLFTNVARTRRPELAGVRFGPPLDLEAVAAFLGQCVVGNMRAFIFALNELLERGGETVGVKTLGETMLSMATNYFWPLLDEVAPKLGKYVPMVDPARTIAEHLFQQCAQKARRNALVHRDVIARLSKPFEILEYAGFISRREASRAMKSGGRGTRYALNLCNLVERVSGTRLTTELYETWRLNRDEPLDFHARGALADITLPALGTEELGVLKMSVETLRRSPAYPYGLTDRQVEVLLAGNFKTVGDLASASDKTLKALDGIGDAHLRRIRNVVAQAVWM